MRIKVLETPNLLIKHKVEADNLLLTKVPVVGPPDQIELLSKGIVDLPYAILNIERKDVTNEKGSARLEFKFPKGAEGVHVRPDYEYVSKDFEFRIVSDQP